jgi:hypothetical protein
MSGLRHIQRLVVSLALASISLLAPGALGAATPAAGAVTAHTARTSLLNESGHLHLTSKHNFTLNEVGPAVGTARGTIYVHLTLLSSSRAKAEVNIYPSGGGSISGRATAGYHRSGSIATFSGSLSIAAGSGSYSHISGSGLSFSGEILESNSDAITVHVVGRVSD